MGVFKPVILIPEEFIAAPDENHLRVLFAHELCHVRSRDLLWTYVIQWLSVFLWFHPLVWGIGRVHTAACEDVTDAVTSAYLGSAEIYSTILARVALNYHSARLRSAAIPMARKSGLSRRLANLKRPLRSMPLKRGWVMTALLAGLALTSVVGVVEVVGEPTNLASKNPPMIQEEVSSASGEATSVPGEENAVTATSSDEKITYGRVAGRAYKRGRQTYS